MGRLLFVIACVAAALARPALAENQHQLQLAALSSPTQAPSVEVMAVGVYRTDLPRDLEAQALLTLSDAAARLAAQGRSWADVREARATVLDPRQIAALSAAARRLGASDLDWTITLADLPPTPGAFLSVELIAR